MHIDFEGITGSGKTTLIDRVAARLSRMGRRVTCARCPVDGASVASRVAQLEEAVVWLGVHPRAALLLSLGRRIQLLEDSVRPALRRGEVCFTEGVLAPPQPLGVAALARSGCAIDSALELTDHSLPPDLVVLLDADPALTRWRIGLDGAKAACWSEGAEVRARASLLAMAQQDRARWVIIETEGLPLHLLEERITEAILARLDGRIPQIQRLVPHGPSRPSSPPLQQLETAFFDALDSLLAHEPAVAVRMLRGIGGLGPMRRRLEALERWPQAVAHSLEGLGDTESQAMRAVLLELAPAEVAAGLEGLNGPWVDRLRERLVGVAPGEVASTLSGDDRQLAWSWRERALAKGCEAEVLRGLGGLDGARAWRVRTAGISRGWMGPAAESLTGLTGLDAEALRDRLFQDAPLSVLASTRGLASAHAFEVRERLLDRAPAAVLRSLAGLEHASAHAIRERLAPYFPEALESVFELDSEAAFRLREHFLPAWPEAAVGSLGRLAGTERGRALLSRALAEAGHRIGVLRNAYACVAGAEPRQPSAPAPSPGTAATLPH